MIRKLSLCLGCALLFVLALAATAQEATQEVAQTATQEVTQEAPTLEPLPQELLDMFDYDANAPLDLEIVGTEMRGNVTIQDVTYTSPVDGEAITAYLIVPPGEGPFPAVLFVHWYESTSPLSNRTQFVDEAVALAETYGVISLLPETMWSDPDWYQQGRSLDTDYADAFHQVIELRRGLDVLLSQPGVDTSRVAYVGHDFGAMYGSLLAGVDHRASAYVLIAGASDFNQWMLFGVPDDQPGLDAYKAQMAELAPSRFIAHAGAPVLFQFGTEDFYTPQSDIDAFVAGAVEPKTVKLYPTEHAMDLPEIRDDRRAFLVEHLALVER